MSVYSCLRTCPLRRFGRVGLTKLEELAPAIKNGYASGKRTCINVEVDVSPIPPEIELLMASAQLSQFDHRPRVRSTMPRDGHIAV